MDKKFILKSDRIIQLEKIPRNYWYIYEFDEEAGQIKEVRVYTRQWIHNGTVFARYTENQGVSTFYSLCRLWKWKQGLQGISDLDLNWSVNSLDFEYNLGVPFEEFEKNPEKFCG